MSRHAATALALLALVALASAASQQPATIALPEFEPQGAACSIHPCFAEAKVPAECCAASYLHVVAEVSFDSSRRDRGGACVSLSPWVRRPRRRRLAVMVLCTRMLPPVSRQIRERHPSLTCVLTPTSHRATPTSTLSLR